jgi:AraC-like DNA-binding protein
MGEKLVLGMAGFGPSGTLLGRQCFPLLAGLEEKTAGASYDWDNSRRASACLFQYTLSGCGELVVQGQSHRVPAGHGLLVRMPSASAYRLPRGGSWRFIFLKFWGTGVQEWAASTLQKPGRILRLAADSPPVELMRRLLAMALEGADDEPSLSALTYSFVCELDRHCGRPSNDLPEPIQRALAIIETSYSEPWLNAECIATRLGLSRAHFSRLFARHLGVAPYEYLVRRRLKEARELLLSTSLPTRIIAEMTGYARPAHFCRTFHQRFGQAPQQFRRSETS